MPFSFLMEALGGLGLFILGMKFMSEGLQKLAGEKLRQVLEKITGNRFAAALTGSALASLLQSSSTASIIVIGFVNAGLISLYQALAVLIGTGLGTTIAIQFIAFKISFFALPLIFAGVVLRCFSSRRRWVNVGTMLLGAGLVFFGLHLMENGFAPLKDNTLIHGLGQHFLSWRLPAMLLGALIAFLMQSGSAAIGIVIAFAGSGLVGFNTAVAMVVGESLGSSIITAIASINGTLAARRTALLYILVNFAAVSLAMILFPLLLQLVRHFSPGEADFAVQGMRTLTVAPLVAETKPYIARHLANAHTIFTALSVLLFLPLVGFFARSAPLIVPGREGDGDMDPRPRYLDQRVLNTPTIALLQAKKEVKRMGEVAGTMFLEMAAQFEGFNARTAGRLKQKEEVLDILQRDISAFLITLSRRQLSTENAMELPVLLQLINELEHLGDQVEAIMDYLRRKKEDKLRFSNAAMAEIRTLSVLVSRVVATAVNSLDPEQTPVEGEDPGPAMKEIELALATLHLNHTKRLHSGKCSVSAGLLFSDIIASFEKIAYIAYSTIKKSRELQ
ncbi:Na/Pi cotransporter family protein [Geotalea sp. SG265]|uniref:Na/Pi cotransporter family protein n=1 Tax=Geotalea sp. SG265 TaxID=2922867 RepID=UPI001FAF71BB|nr:Na/Pi cotransporter family protein [Geotalea sp. SG265]